jgi:beta-lactamase class A
MRRSAYRIGAPVVEPVVISIAAGDRVMPTPRHSRGVGSRGPRTERTIPASIVRRAVFAGSLLALPAFANDASSALADLERRNGGRLGVAALDTASGRQASWRSDERFPLCSTFKFLAAALVLSRVDHGDERLDRRIVFSAKDLVTYSPVTQDHVGSGGMSVAEICEAAVTLSDNTAGNLLLASFGGPPALTAYARTLGDGSTRLDRIETELNEAVPGDPRDTTTPNAMLGDMQRLVVGDALSAGSRERLIGWLLASKTGGKRLRAGLPPDWRTGDKTGGGSNGTANDIAVAWRPGRAPILVAVYFTGSTISDDARNAVIADVGRLAAANLG